MPTPASSRMSRPSPTPSPIPPTPAAPRLPYEVRRVLDAEELPLTSSRVRRCSLVEVDFKYPILRVEETLLREPGSEDRVLDRSVTVGDHVMVRLQPHATEAQLRTLVGKRGDRILRKMHAPGLYLVAMIEPTLNGVPSRVAEYGRAGEVIRFAEPNAIFSLDQVFPDDTSFTTLWGLHNTGQSGGTADADIDAPEAWEIITDAGEIVVGLIDSGTDYDHVDLASNIWTNPGEIPGNSIDDDNNGFIDDVYGWDFFSDDNDPNDELFHGTHTAGTIAAVGNNNLGVVGVCWRAKIMAIKITDNTGRGDLAVAIEAIHYATMMRTNGVNIRLTSNSWGEESFSQALRESVEAHERAGMLFVCSAGNNYRNIDTGSAYYPSRFTVSNIVSVANTTRTDAKRDSSNWGAISVDLAAPGTSILSTYPNNSYGTVSGTSMSAPHVAGAAALLWALNPEMDYRDVKDLLLSGVDIIPSMTGNTVSDGRLNVYASMLLMEPEIHHVPPANSSDTTGGYPVTADVVPGPLMQTNQVYVAWNTNGSTAHFTTNTMLRLSNDTFRAVIPAQTLGTPVHYFLHAGTLSGHTVRDPASAPTALHVFEITESIPLIIFAEPADYGVVVPDYGIHRLPSGNVINATAELHTTPNGGTRFACTGWEGSGDVSSSGTSNSFAFTLREMSMIIWQWTNQYSLTQTSLEPGLWSTTTWWNASSTAETVVAPETLPAGNTNFHFASWFLEGSRQPDASNTAVNPLSGFFMVNAQTATVLYLPSQQDTDVDDLPDWWEIFHFGTTNASPSSDSDGDTFANTNEFLDGTDPNNAASFPTPPVIAHDPLPNPAAGPAPWTVGATATDNYVVAGVTLWWQQNTGTWQSIAMEMADGAGLYTNAIPAPGINGDVFAYAIAARDDAGFEIFTVTNVFAVAYPVIDVSPTSIAEIVRAGTGGSNRVVIANSGITNLSWRVDRIWGDFVEPDNTGWSHSGANDRWRVSTARAHSPPYAWHCGIGPPPHYISSMDARLDAPPVLLGNGAQLQFWHWILSELDIYDDRLAYDAGIVEISTNDGTSFAQITPVGGYPYETHGWERSTWTNQIPCFAGNGEWRKETFDLSAYSNRQAIIRFRFGNDDNTEYEGWYIDDVTIDPVVLTNDWLQISPTNGNVGASSSNAIALGLVATNIPTGNFRTVLRVFSNDSSSPTSDVHVSMRVRSPPVVRALSAAQTATNGSGRVAITNSVSDVDGEACALEILYSLDTGATWHTARVDTAAAELGSTGISNGAPQVTGIVTTNALGAATNTIAVTWDTTNSPLPVLLTTGALVRARLWDGLFWSDAVTSFPFLVDNEAPSIPSAFTVISHISGTWSTSGVIGATWSAANDGAGIGVAGYAFSAAEGIPSVPASVSTTNLFAGTAPLGDSSNWWVAVRTVDRAGNAGSATNLGPFRIDVTPPVNTAAVLSLAHSAYGEYTLSTTITGAWTGFVDAAAGIAGYYYSLTNRAGTTNGTWTAGSPGLAGGAELNQTNLMYVWARDNVGLIGDAAWAAMLVLDPSGDFDEDGAGNGEEEVAGTDATRGESVFALDASAGAGSTGSTDVVLTWPSHTNRRYALYHTPALTNLPAAWAPAFTDRQGQAEAMVYTDHVLETEHRFYRLTVEAP